MIEVNGSTRKGIIPRGKITSVGPQGSLRTLPEGCRDERRATTRSVLRGANRQVGQSVGEPRSQCGSQGWVSGVGLGLFIANGARAGPPWHRGALTKVKGVHGPFYYFGRSLTPLTRIDGRCRDTLESRGVGPA